MRNWAGLLEDLLCLICKRLDSLKDFVAFRGVCSEWRRQAVEQNLGQTLLPLPCLMLAENQESDFIDFYSVTEGNTCSIELPELRGKKCMETKGWIVTASETGEMALVHPFTRVKIPLPHQNTSICYDKNWMDPLIFVQSAVLSSPYDPKNETDCVLMIVHGGLRQIGFCRPGDKNWTVVENHFICPVMSIECYRGKFYVQYLTGDVGEYDVIGKSNAFGHVSFRRNELSIERYVRYRQMYVVESAGSLLVVIRKRREELTFVNTKFWEKNCVTTAFWVLEIDVDKGGYKIIRSLGKRAIFLGHSAILSVDTTLYPNLIPNSIYFTDDCYEFYLGEAKGGGTDMGVYNLEDGSSCHYARFPLSNICPPVWTFITTG